MDVMSDIPFHRYVTKMKEFALQKISEKKDWLLLDFCQLGFIGKALIVATLPCLPVLIRVT